MTDRQKGLLKTAVKLLISVTAMIFVFRSIDWPQTRELLYASHFGYLLLALLLFAASKVVSAFRLLIYFKNIDLHLSSLYNLQLAWLGMFYNLFLPGGIGGDGYKVYLLHRRSRIQVKRLGAAVLIDRISGVVALLFLALIGVSFLQVATWPDWVPPAAIFLALLAFPSLYLLKKWVFPSFTGRFIETSLLSLLTQGIQVVCAFFILSALGLPKQLLEYLVLFLASSVVAILPFTIGGVGARELTFILSYEYMGIDKNLAVAFSLIFFLINAFVSAFGFLFDVKNNGIKGQSTSSDSNMSMT